MEFSRSLIRGGSHEKSRFSDWTAKNRGTTGQVLDISQEAEAALAVARRLPRFLSIPWTKAEGSVMTLEDAERIQKIEHSGDLMPPIELILKNGIGHEAGSDIPDLFHQYGRGLIAGMVRDGVLKPNSRVLDVGCGLGRLARILTSFLSPRGSYHGIDVCKSSIDWCVLNYANHLNFKFEHADVFSTHYNPAAISSAANYSFPFNSREFDFIFSTSLFTHLIAKDAEHYIEEMARVLKPGGKIWNTFLLLDDISTPLASTFDPEHAATHLPIIVDRGRIALESDPEALTALDKSFVEEVHRRSGLELLEVRNGPWSGRTDNIRASYQDVVIARKPRFWQFL